MIFVKYIINYRVFLLFNHMIIKLDAGLFTIIPGRNPDVKGHETGL